MKIRKLLFTSAFIAFFILIAIVCFIVGRGHTVYFDNKSLDGTNYSSYDSIDIIYKGEKVTTLGKAERINLTFTGQKLTISYKSKKTKAAQAEEGELYFNVPYNMDGIVINLPALLDGADESIYMSEYVPAIVIEDEDEVPNTDEFEITSEEE